ncbi:MAG: glycosyltransferase family 1 protein [Sulfitobacter sp.]
MPRARLLDLTRSLRRAGRVATGVDRVEHAYLSHLLADNVPTFGLVRTAFGYALLDQSGLDEFLDRIEGNTPWGQIDLLSRLPRGRSVAQKQAESDVRRFAISRGSRSRLTNLLADIMPDGYVYYNVGHSNLTIRVFNAVRASGGKAAVMVHDVIPLEHPEFQRAGSVAPFREKMRRVSAHADWVIYNSEDTKQRAESYMQEWGRVPMPIVAHLGTIVPTVNIGSLPAEVPTDQPYFVVVGTIEPRKNHALLLDIWEEMGADVPPLFICGGRGWNNDAVFARLDHMTPNKNIYELPNLDDGTLAALVQGAAGMLFPSHAEGYGLPPLEALSLGTRVLCNDLQVLREILGNKAVYAPVSERYLWISTIKNWAINPPPVLESEPFIGPNWPDHFKTVLRLR